MAKITMRYFGLELQAEGEEAFCLRQTETGVQSMQLDETGEWHAVLGYEIMTSNGLKIK